MAVQTAPKALQRGQLAKLTGCNPETVRYYEAAGLLPKPPRTEGGYRSYAPESVRRLRFILRARELGFTLDAIRELLRLVDERDQSCAGARVIATAHLGDVRTKIADLRRMQRVLQDVITQCAGGSLAECRLIETLFKEGSDAGAGAGG
jgi:MerR family mercuric resistance operon transcriptional regulator